MFVLEGVKFYLFIVFHFRRSVSSREQFGPGCTELKYFGGSTF